MIITIDGPAGTGKTTIARLVSQKLNFEYFDTGAMYRALTYYIERQAIDVSNKALLLKFLNDFHFDIRNEGNEKKYFVNELDVTLLIRTAEVTKNVSKIAAIPEVRMNLIHIQKAFSHGRHVVFEGRDMGTVVFPKADFKFFLTARPAVRAERRYFEFKQKEMPITEEEVLRELLIRDHLDSTREIAPLKQAEDAFLIDTSDFTIEEVTQQILNYIKKNP